MPRYMYKLFGFTTTWLNAKLGMKVMVDIVLQGGREWGLKSSVIIWCKVFGQFQSVYGMKHQ